MLVVLSSALRSKSTRIFVPYLSLPIYEPWGSVFPLKLNGYILATEDAGKTLSYCAPNIFAPTGRIERNPSFCRKVSLSTEILERVSSIAMSLCNSLSFSILLAFSSMNTDTWSSGSLFLRRLARSSITSCKLPSASMLSLTSLPPLLRRFLRVAFWIILRCSIDSTSLW